MTGQSLAFAASSVSRRAFIGGAAALGFAGAASAHGLMRGDRPASRPDEPAIDEKFAMVVQVGAWDGGGAWAIISKGGQTFTLCNGGIIAGKDAVLMVDGFNTYGGARWASGAAKKLTGRDPTHVVVTHYHFDHTDGLVGYAGLPEIPTIISTSTTRDLMAKRGNAGGGNLFFPAPASRIPGLKTSVAKCLLPDAVIEDSSKPLAIDIGGKTVVLRERAGHTASDLNVEIDGGAKDGSKLVYAGDMIFNKVFPVYLDALPTTLRKNVAEAIGENRGTNTIVPGHGPVSTGEGLKPFLAVIDHFAAAAKKAHDAKVSPKDAAAGYALPPELQDFAILGPGIIEMAFAAWEREQGGK